VKIDIPVPFERLAWFQGKLDWGMKSCRKLSRHRDLFVPRKQEFADSLFHRFYEIKRPGPFWNTKGARKNSRGSGATGTSSFSRGASLRGPHLSLEKRAAPCGYQPGQALRHLAYSFVRIFFQEICHRSVPPAGHYALLAAFDKVVDFCVLIETHAYVTATSQCDMEVVKGISHQVRNPLTVIGGNILRLQRKAEPGSPIHKTYEMILMESKRLENMVRDAAIYSELFQAEPTLSTVSLTEAVPVVLKRLEVLPEMGNARIETHIDPEHSYVQGDPAALETLLYQLLQNGIEAMDPPKPPDPDLVAGSRTGAGFCGNRDLHTGKPPDPEELEPFFVPFYSTKSFGTGFGLPLPRSLPGKASGCCA